MIVAARIENRAPPGFANDVITVHTLQNRP